jgi:hypothetical protein
MQDVTLLQEYKSRYSGKANERILLKAGWLNPFERGIIARPRIGEFHHG